LIYRLQYDLTSISS